MINLNKIDSSRHIVLLSDEESFPNASALYSFILTRHKKVSLVAKKPISKNLAFLPWFDKVRRDKPTSADLSIETDNDVLFLLHYFKNEEIKINKKMATALYAGILKRYDFFTSYECDDIVLSLASELIVLNAEYKECLKYMKNQESLSSFRLKALLYKNMLLVENASVAHLYLSDYDLKTSGAQMDEVYKTMNEVLTLAHIKEVKLIKSDEENRTLKSIKEKYFEK
ncbi:DHH family phosphoesterase [Sulfurimonas sp.]